MLFYILVLVLSNWQACLIRSLRTRILLCTVHSQQTSLSKGLSKSRERASSSKTTNVRRDHLGLWWIRHRKLYTIHSFPPFVVYKRSHPKLRHFITPEQYNEIFAVLREYIPPVSTNVGSFISKLLYTTYPPHFFNPEIADLSPLFPLLIDSIMSYYRYGSSPLGTMFLPLVSRMMAGDEQHVYPWHQYSTNLIHSSYIAIKEIKEVNANDEKVGTWDCYELLVH